MRILIVVEQVFKSGSGAVFMSETDILISEGHEVAHFLYVKPSGSMVKTYVANGIGAGSFTTKPAKNPVSKIFRASVSGVLKIINLFFGAQFFATDLEKALLDFKPDIIRYHAMINNYIQPECIKLVKKYKTPFLITCHDAIVVCPSGELMKGGIHGTQCNALCSQEKIPGLSNLKNACRSGLFSRIWHSYRFNRRVTSHVINEVAALVVCPSQALYDYIANTNLVDKDRLKFSQNPVVLKDVESTILGPSKQSYFLFFGRLVPAKGLDVLLNVFESLPDVQLVIIGEGSMQKSVIERISRLNTQNIKYAGWVEDKELDAYIKGAVAVVLPAIGFDNAPVSIIDAYNYGRPVISSNFGGATESILHGETGFLYAPTDQEALKRYVLTFWHDTKLADDFGNKGKQYLQQFYSKEVVIKRLGAMYEEALVNAQKYMFIK